MESPTFGKTALIIRWRKSLHQNQSSHRVSQKNCLKRGTQMSSWAHIYMAFSVVWTGNQHCSVPHSVYQFWDTLYLSLIKPIHGQNVSLWISTKSPALVEFPAPGQLSKVKSRPPGNFFELIPGGCPGGMYPVGIDWDIKAESTHWQKLKFLRITSWKGVKEGE